MMHTDIFIVGAGIAGISAAKEAAKSGLDVVLADRESGFGGVLRQCMHRGFGPGLTGPEYVEQLRADFPGALNYLFSTTVLKVNPDKTAVLSNADGITELSFKHMILATGCMEINAAMLPIGGTRPEGVYTAGEAQLMSFMGEKLPSPVVILGSGDLGLIMAEQLMSQGHKVSCIIERNSAPTAMARNRKALEKVPLILNSTVSSIHGDARIESITAMNLQSGEEYSVPCSSLLISAGLKPDRSLVRGMENEPWLTLCGNCMRIYTMVEGLVAETKEAVKGIKTND